MKKRITLACLLSTLVFHVHADDNAITTEEQKFSYAIGFQMAQQLKSQGIPLDASAVSQAVKDVLSNGELKITVQEMSAVFESFQQKRMSEMQAVADTNKKAGEAFLEKNKSADGVTVLDSGIQYKVLKAGTGKSPTATDTVTVNYRGTLIDGTVFDSSYDRGEPVSFGLSGVIKGWQEVIPLMKEGAKWQVFIPSDLAYGPRAVGQTIGPNSTLIFEIELLSMASANHDGHDHNH